MEIKKQPHINIENILNSKNYARAFQVRNYDDLHILKDTCSIKRIPQTETGRYALAHKRETGEKYNFLLTHRVSREMHKYSDMIPWHLVHHVYSILSEVIHPEVPQENFNSIRQIVLKRTNSDIGITDIQMISYAMERARQNKQTLIISDDSHILNAVSHLRKKSDEQKCFRANMFAFPLQKHLN